MISTSPYNNPLREAAEDFCDLIENGQKLGKDLLLGCLCEFDILRRHPPSPIFGNRYSRAAACGCDIPPACWAPLPIGELCSEVCPGATATVRLRITNCGATTRDFTIETAGDPATVNPTSLTLGPMERGFVVASSPMPPDAHYGYEREVLVWVRGFRDHFLRWCAVVSRYQECACLEVEVEDCPDYIHHWYDHFYCKRPGKHY